MSKAVKKKILILFFPLVFILFSTVLNPDPANPVIGKMIGISIWMLGWWIAEVVPIAVTSLLPIILFPLTGIASSTEISRYYFSDVIFLYIGGFMLAFAIEKWEVHKRIAVKTLMFFGKGTLQIFIGFMLTTSLISFWISNTAVALLMLPIGISVLDELREIYSEKELGKFKIALLLGIAYASSIGGITTLIGTPTNLVFVRIYDSAFPNGTPVTFANWFILCFPMYIILIAVGIIVLFLFYKPKKSLEIIDGSFFKVAQLRLGKRTYEQKVVLFIFALFAILMIFRADIVIGSFRIPGWSSLFTYGSNISDAVVAAFISVLLFIIPSKSLPGTAIMDWNSALRIPWGIILLFGGGFALERGFEISGLTLWISSKLGDLSGSPLLIIILVFSFLTLLFTQLVANVTTAQALVPICIPFIAVFHINPLYLMLPVTLCASMAFLLPFSTPPNAIVFAPGQFKMKQMILPGIILMVISGLVISLIMYYWGSYVFNI